MSESDNAGSAAKLAAVSPVTVKTPSSIAELIDKWFVAHFHGTELGNHTHLWNQVHNAKEELKVLLADL